MRGRWMAPPAGIFLNASSWTRMQSFMVRRLETSSLLMISIGWDVRSLMCRKDASKESGRANCKADGDEEDEREIRADLAAAGPHGCGDDGRSHRPRRTGLSRGVRVSADQCAEATRAFAQECADLQLSRRCGWAWRDRLADARGIGRARADQSGLSLSRASGLCAVGFGDERA